MSGVRFLAGEGRCPPLQAVRISAHEFGLIEGAAVPLQQLEAGSVSSLGTVELSVSLRWTTHWGFIVSAAFSADSCGIPPAIHIHRRRTLG